jgi:hypothetical protein
MKKVLRDLPLASPIDYFVDDDSHNTTIKLFDNQQQLDRSNQLINSNDPYLVDVINRTLSHIDTYSMYIFKFLLTIIINHRSQKPFYFSLEQ